MGIRRMLVKIGLGIASILTPLLFLLSFTILGSGHTTTSKFFIVFFILTAASWPGLMVFYVIHVYRNRGIAANQRRLWTALLVLGNVLVYPVYWYLYIWREPKVATGGQKPDGGSTGQRATPDH